MTRINRGLNIPINGKPEQKIENGPAIKTVALVGADYVGMKPSMRVKEGDSVRLGQPLFECKKNTGVIYTAPASGKVIAINRGEKRVFQSLVIEVAPGEQIEFSHYLKKEIKDYSREEVASLLIESGLWSSLRKRPFSRVACPTDIPHSLFINASDSNPLCADASVVLATCAHNFVAGVEVLAKLTKGKTFVCHLASQKIPAISGSGIEVHAFSGPHPAGNVGTHIHYLDPVNAKKTVWHANYQDVAAIGKLFTSGVLDMDRVISLAGPMVKRPRLIKTVVGACISELTAGELLEKEVRVVSGSLLNGRKAQGDLNYLGRFHQQISVVEEDRSRELLGWHMPGLNKFSVKRTFLSWMIPGKTFDFNTKLNGSPRALVPIGSFEQIMDLDILATPLLKALLTRDTDGAQALGCLELDEEDLALCTFVSPGKADFGPILRENLTIIEKEG